MNSYLELCNGLLAAGIAITLNASVKNAYKRYQKVANGCWTVQKRATSTKATKMVVEAEEDSNFVDEDEDRDHLESFSSGLTSRTASPDPSPGEDKEFSTPATALSDHRSSLASCPH